MCCRWHPSQATFGELVEGLGISWDSRADVKSSKFTKPGFRGDPLRGCPFKVHCPPQ
ncbi:MAG: hypothetical protein CM15mP92_2570 [Halieaceae bacterium]|nr:MAG: hypothetical protein CM15mP92_2570 [Halieaceae bacterium]